jgi:hypothetical protein
MTSSVVDDLIKKVNECRINDGYPLLTKEHYGMIQDMIDVVISHCAVDVINGVDDANDSVGLATLLITFLTTWVVCGNETQSLDDTINKLQLAHGSELPKNFKQTVVMLLTIFNMRSEVKVRVA